MRRRLKIVDYKRFIVSLLIAVTVIFLVFYISISASEQKDSNTKELTYYYVNSGDTLWDIAIENKGNSDVRTYLYLLKKANALKTSEISPGLKLIIP